MKKRLYEVCCYLSIAIAALVWLISSFVEGFDFGVLGFLATTLLLYGTVNVIFSFVERKYQRMATGGASIFLGVIALLSVLKILNFVAVICLLIIIGALTSIFSLLIKKGDKWDAGDNDKN